MKVGIPLEISDSSNSVRRQSPWDGNSRYDTAQRHGLRGGAESRWAL